MTNNICDYIPIDTVDTTKGIRISSISQRQRLPKGCVAQSLPMAVPIFNHRSDDDYDEEV